MKRVFKLQFFLSLFIVLSSCEQEVDDIPLPKTEPKLVVYSYISPSKSTIEVEVTKSVPFFGNTSQQNEYETVKDATVQLISGGRSVQLPFDSQSEKYSIPNDGNFPIVAGQLYSLNVSAPGGFSCSAQTRVPSVSASSITVELDSTIRNNEGFQEKQYRIITKWDDVIGVDNYYHYSLQIFGASYVSCNEALTDVGSEGMEISRTCHYTTFYDRFRIDGSAFVLTTDVAYYKYHESYYRYEDENPFAEPVRIFSNIEGGLGCFGSYIKQEVSLRS